MESAKKKFTTDASEIMSAGAEAIMLTLVDKPSAILIEDALTDLVAKLAAVWVNRKENDK